MTSDKKLEQEMEPLSCRSENSPEQIGTNSEAVEESMSFTHLDQKQEPGQLSGKNAEELGVGGNDSDASHGGAIPAGQPTSPPLSVSPSPGLQVAMGGTLKQTHKNWLVVSIAIGAVFLLIAAGMLRGLLIPRTPAKRAMGALIYTYHTMNQGIYPTYINSVAWSPDSIYIACGTGDGTVHVLQPAAQREVLVYHGHHSWVNNLVWFPDGKRIASASADHTVQIWDATTGHTISTFTSTSSVWAVAVSRNSNFIAWAGKDGVVQVWQISPRKHISTYTQQAHAGKIWGLAFSPDGTRIASGDGAGVIQIWDATNGGHILTYRGQTKQIYDLKWSPNGQYIASASADGTVHIWNASNGRTVYIHRFSAAPVQAISWSPDGTRIASASADGTVQLWDALDGGHPFVYRHHSGAVYTVAWSADGSMIASGDESGALQVWQAR